MGISGLLPLLKPMMKRKHINMFHGQKIGIDGLTWLYNACSHIALDIFLGNRTDYHLKIIKRKIDAMRQFNIYPLFVVDGCKLPLKKVTNDKRSEIRCKYNEKCREAILKKDYKQASVYARGCLSISSDLLFEFIEFLKIEKVEYLIAPYEADPQLVYLQKIGYIDAIMTIDSDYIVFGATKILYNFDGSNVLEYNSRNLYMIKDSFLIENLMDICILSGCDYLPSIKGIGLKKSREFLFNTKSIDNFVKYCMEKKKIVPENYLQNFAKAKTAFYFSIVYDPIKMKRVTLNYCDKEFLFLGTLTEEPFLFGEFSHNKRHFIPA